MQAKVEDDSNKDKSNKQSYSSDHNSVYRILMFQECGQDITINQEDANRGYVYNDVTIIIDSGANRHVFATPEYFNCIELLKEPRSFVSANNQRTVCSLGGDVLWLKDVLYLPTAHSNIISLSCLQESGFGARLVQGGMEILLPDGQRLLTARLVHGMYRVIWDDMMRAKDHILDYWTCLPTAQPSNINVSAVMLSMHETLELLHKRLGHISMKRIKHLVDAGYLSSETSISPFNDHVCDACKSCQSTRRSFPHTFPECTFPLERVHMDVQGPFRVTSLTGHNYIVGFIDAYSRMSFTYYVKNKSDVYDVLTKEFYPNVMAFMKEQPCAQRHSPYTIISDNGEFKSNRVKEFLSMHGVRQLFTCPYTPEHNGLIERLWRTLHTMASTMLNEKRVRPDLWEEAHRTANYLYNRIPPSTVSSHGLISPYQLFYGGSPPTLSHIRMFGSKAFIHKTDTEMSKSFDPKAYEGIFVGYDEDHIKSYRIYIPHTRILAITAHVTIDEEYIKLQDMYPFTPQMTLSETPSHFEISDPPIETKSVSDFEHLIGSTHKDDEDGMVYQTTRVCIEHGLIVAYRCLVNKNGQLSRKEDGPIHVKDIVRLTNDYDAQVSPTIQNMMSLFDEEQWEMKSESGLDKSIIREVPNLKEELTETSILESTHSLEPGKIPEDTTTLRESSAQRRLKPPDRRNQMVPIKMEGCTSSIDQSEVAPQEYSAVEVLNKLLSVVTNKRKVADEDSDTVGTDTTGIDTAGTVLSKKQRWMDKDPGDDSKKQRWMDKDPGEDELTSSNTRSRADPPRSSSGTTNIAEGSHDPNYMFGLKSKTSQGLVFHLLDSVYRDEELRNRLITEKSELKRYVTTINRHHERTAINILKRRARQGDIIANLLVDNNINSDLLARYQSCQYEPVNHDEAMSTEDKDKWMAAERAEIQSLVKNKVFAIVDRPSTRKPIPCKWIYKRKKSKSGTVEKFKARLVAKGFHQIYGQDFSETFSPVARLTTIRLLYSIAVLLNLRVTQLDVETAFLNAELPEDEQVYIEPPPLMDLPKGKCYRLQRSLYGLKQSPRLWNNTINKFLVEIGFRRLTTDACIYVKGTPNSGQPYTILALYVDDLVIMSNDDGALVRVISQMKQRFTMKDFGTLEHVLGTEVFQEERAIWISQRNFAVQLLSKHGYLDDSKFTPRMVPISPTTKLSKSMCPSTPEEHEFMLQFDRATKFREIMGALLWLAINTRPDIMYAVNQLSKYNNNPGPQHWYAMEKVLRYIKGTLDYGICFNSTDSEPQLLSQLFGVNSSTFNETATTPNVMEPIIASDADFNRDNDTSKSVSGYVFLLAGAPISWHSTTQSVVALSSMESEYIAVCAATQEAIWLKSIIEELGLGCTKPLIIAEDNKSTIEFADHPGHHRKTKHIQRRFHYVREQLQEGNIRLKYCRGEDNVADIFTKPLYPDEFCRHRNQLVRKIPSHLFRP